ncbi:hypothetical protein [Candidatus Tokpelaia sp.]|uniref:hypothetical protein n=1 Tax=Candidatus Tokpelaia sp. TaxID=2233777 RepID=UPI001680581C|nr:hypothetical protein [Candidatus Tokpelaia sp.]
MACTAAVTCWNRTGSSRIVDTEIIFRAFFVHCQISLFAALLQLRGSFTLYLTVD